MLKDKDLKLILKESLRTRTRTRTNIPVLECCSDDNLPESADLVDTEVDNVDVSDVENWTDKKRGHNPDDDQDNDRSALSRVQLLAAARRRFHREVVIDAQSRQREDATRDCQTCRRHSQIRYTLHFIRFQSIF